MGFCCDRDVMKAITYRVDQIRKAHLLLDCNAVKSLKQCEENSVVFHTIEKWTEAREVRLWFSGVHEAKLKQV